MTGTHEAVVFIASKHTSTDYRRVLWRVTREDAKKICNDSRTSGQRFMLCWADQDIDDPILNRYVPDSGATDDVLRDHNIRILHSAQHQHTRRGSR